MDNVLSVSELTREIKSLIEGSFHGLHVRGEISNWRPASSGHVYFALTDKDAKMPAVMWRSSAARLKFQPEDGLQVVASGKVDVYAPRGAYQMIVTSIEPAGAGAAALALEQLKQKLLKEGLLDPSRKRPIPSLPRRIGIVTSPTGQAIRDLVRNLVRRFPRCWVTLRPAKVQGDGAAADVAQGIRDLDELGDVDVVIVGRGGGSAEDLASFNDEALARAIAGCSVPVISAVGHEGDISIADLVADLRVSTPTAAAEEAVPVLRDLEDGLQSLQDRLVEALRGRVDLGRERVRSLEQRHALRRPVDRVHDLVQRVDELRGRLDGGVRALLERRRETLSRAAAHADGVSPLRVLARGYSVTTREDSWDPIVDATTLKPGERIRTRLATGEVHSTVDDGSA